MKKLMLVLTLALAGFQSRATANPNDTDEFRYAMVNIYVDAQTRYSGAGHVCTDHLGLTVGDVLPDDEFPRF